MVFAIHAQQSDETAIRNVLYTQQQAWNNGNIEGFMQAYWKNDSLMFIGKRGITYGWQQTLQNYKTGYPDKAAMGVLQFDIISIHVCENGTAHVIGKWDLHRNADKGNLGGCFTLLMRKIKNTWVIVADHTS